VKKAKELQVKKNSFIKGLIGVLPKLSFDDNAVGGQESEAVEEVSSRTGVEKYLESKSAVTRVEKYLKKHPHDPATGVAKYVAKRILSDKPATTRVSKYIIKQGVLKKEKPGISRVEQYVVKQSLKPKNIPTGVALYVRKKDKEAKAKIPTTRVGYVLWQKEIAIKKQAAEALAEKYRLAEAEAAKQPKKIEDVPQDEPVFDPLATGVAKYLARAESEQKHVATGVTKYIARKRTLSGTESRTGVDKYLLKKASSPKPLLTRVEKYVVMRSLSKPAEEHNTGVDKYLVRKETLGVQRSKLSRVSKYLLKLSILKNQVRKDKSVSQEEEVASENADVENDNVNSRTKVEQYLAKKAENAPQESHRTSRVEAYLAKKVAEDAVKKYENLTGVEKYLNKKKAA